MTEKKASRLPRVLALIVFILLLLAALSSYLLPKTGADLLRDPGRVVECQVMAMGSMTDAVPPTGYITLSEGETATLVETFSSTSFRRLPSFRREKIESYEAYRLFFRYDDGTGILFALDGDGALFDESPDGWPPVLGQRSPRYADWCFTPSGDALTDLLASLTAG